jgi:hypothetical protein
MTLIFIQNGMVAEANTVAAFNRANAFIGGGLRITAPYGANRTTAQQTLLRTNYLKLGPSKGWNYAAPPGQSNHEGGHALDINNWASFPTLRPVMEKFGFRRDPVEQWHYNYTGAVTTSGGSTSVPISNTPLPEPEKDTKMYIISDGAALYLVGGTNIVHLGPEEHALFDRFLNKGDGAFNNAQVQMIQNVMQRLHAPYPAFAAKADVDAGVASLKKDLGYLNTDSPDSLKAIHADVKAIKPGSTTVNTDVAAVAAAVEATLKDDFAAIPKAVNDDAGKRMDS